MCLRSRGSRAPSSPRITGASMLRFLRWLACVPPRPAPFSIPSARRHHWPRVEASRRHSIRQPLDAEDVLPAPPAPPDTPLPRRPQLEGWRREPASVPDERVDSPLTPDRRFLPERLEADMISHLLLRSRCRWYGSLLGALLLAGCDLRNSTAPAVVDAEPTTTLQRVVQLAVVVDPLAGTAEVLRPGEGSSP